MSLFLINKVKENTQAFSDGVVSIAKQLGIDPDWLMIVMNFESGLNPKATNKNSNAVGLIQFMPKTAQGLGTTTNDLLNMSNVEQLHYVYKYLARYSGRIDSLTDLYLCIFYPVAVGKSDNYVLGTNEENKKLVARLNKVFDTNSDGYLTKNEITQYINNYALKLGYTGKTQSMNSKKKTY